MERYDHDSGLVFRETVLKANRGLSPWEHRCRALKPKYIPPPRGSEPLYVKAMREIVCNTHTLLPETLQAIPTSIVQQIWKTIRRERRESLQIWKLFVESGQGNESFVHSAHEWEDAFAKPIVEYFADMTSQTYAWMTDLCLMNITSSATDLKQLCRLVNLRNLQIHHSKGRKRIVFDDKIMSHWGLSARDNGVFPFLETIGVSNAPEITRDSLHYLGHFPALDAFLLYNTSVKEEHARHVEQFGWSIPAHGQFRTFVDSQDLNEVLRKDETTLKLMIKDYASMRHSANTNRQLPVLSVELSARDRSSTLCDMSDLLCFERDWKVKRLPVEKHANTSTKMGQETSIIKKRKLRHGKALELNTLLETF